MEMEMEIEMVMEVVMAMEMVMVMVMVSRDGGHLNPQGLRWSMLISSDRIPWNRKPNLCMVQIALFRPHSCTF